MSAKRIRVGAAVRDITAGTLGRTVRHALRGYICIQWDGDPDLDSVRIGDVTLVADKYQTAKAWQPAETKGTVYRVAPAHAAASRRRRRATQ